MKSFFELREQLLNELSTDTLKRYVKKAGKDGQHAADHSYGTGPDKPGKLSTHNKTDLYLDRVGKRGTGVDRAQAKLKARGVKPPKVPYQRKDFDPQTRNFSATKPAKVANRKKEPRRVYDKDED